MLDIGGWEFLVVAFVLLMVVGPKELPKLLRGFTRAMRQIRSMASEFTRGMEDLASESELGDLKKTIADAKSGNLDKVADKIDFAADLRGAIADVKLGADFDSTAKELSEIKNIGNEASQTLVPANAPVQAKKKAAKVKPVEKKKS